MAKSLAGNTASRLEGTFNPKFHEILVESFVTMKAKSSGYGDKNHIPG